MDEEIEDELNFIVHQLNESLQSTDTCSMMDAVCDVSVSISKVIDERETLTTNIMLNSLLRLHESDLLSNDDSSLLSYRNFEASYNVYPATLSLTHKYRERSYDIFVEDPSTRKHRIEVNTDKYRVFNEYDDIIE